MSRIAIASVMLVALAGCAPKVAAPVAGGDAPGTGCDAGAASTLVGRAADTVEAEAQRLSGARTVRRYATGDALTMDYRADRLNVETDAGGSIVKLSCG
ncbi:I78 family peptidase inhibitor [Sphingomonas sp. DT-51]|uniref:I78 family peptidase inhibitor n=1 Tax=Sphingomonas sp. DT-51 TaxID=3396165 RepID=UPI003F1933DA